MIEDIFVPKSKPQDALVEQLHTVTYVTEDKETVERLFTQGYGLEQTKWTKAADPNVSRYFGFSHNEWSMCTFYKSGEGANIRVRVIYDPKAGPKVRQECDGLIVGGATISFPKDDLYEHQKLMLELKVSSTIGVKEMDFQSPTGEVYTSAEIIYYAPENVYLLAVKRPDIFVPVGPSDSVSGLSGPAYSARCISDADRLITFFKDVLGFEIRRDVVFPIGDVSAMLLPKGSEERFIQVFAPGASTGYMVLMDHGKENKFSTAPSLGTPNRGIVMWSFMTQNVHEVERRALASNTEIIYGPATVHRSHMGGAKVLLLKDPGGFMIEICESA